MTTPALKEIANRIKHLSYRDLAALAAALNNAMPNIRTEEMILAMADAMDPAGTVAECLGDGSDIAFDHGSSKWSHRKRDRS